MTKIGNLFVAVDGDLCCFVYFAADPPMSAACRQQQNGHPNGILLSALSLEPVDQDGRRPVAGHHGSDHPDAHVTWWDADHRTKEGRCGVRCMAQVAARDAGHHL